MILCALLAVSQNGVIGNDNQLPWHIPEDLKFFKSKTLNHIVIMGRKTFESIGLKPLPQRTNIVLSRSGGPWPNSVVGLTNVDECLSFVADRAGEDEEVFVIGGAEIYQVFEPHIERYYITQIFADFEGTKKFVGPDARRFVLTHQRASAQLTPQALRYEFRTYDFRS